MAIDQVVDDTSDFNKVLLARLTHAAEQEFHIRRYAGLDRLFAPDGRDYQHGIEDPTAVPASELYRRADAVLDEIRRRE